MFIDHLQNSNESTIDLVIALTYQAICIYALQASSYPVAIFDNFIYCRPVFHLRGHYGMSVNFGRVFHVWIDASFEHLRIVSWLGER
jgi:hypothetical protein